MTPEQYEKLQQVIVETVEKTVKTVVNGKIDRINEKLDTYIREDNEYKERIEKETEEWRVGADEKLSLVADVQGFSRIAIKFLAFIIALGGATAVLLRWFHR